MEHSLPNADIQNTVKTFIKAAVFLVLFSSAMPANSYFVTFKEQYYRLFHVHYIQYPDDSMENIYWLEQAIKAPFASPLYALAQIDDEVQWEKYRYLFNMHLHIKLIEQYMFLGNKYNKRFAYFYNAPFKEQNLESLETAEKCFRTALVYWDDVLVWANKANNRRLRWTQLPKVQFWVDEAFRIEKGTLNYKRTIERELKFLQDVREKLQAMEYPYKVQNLVE